MEVAAVDRDVRDDEDEYGEEVTELVFFFLLFHLTTRGMLKFRVDNRLNP